ncbi:hypothetical protein M1558_01555 [Candidatus Parvarchaeota archaeon]|nr:hypothetical protein [Candidatus Parvarchaeota archaeon]
MKAAKNPNENNQKEQTQQPTAQPQAQKPAAKQTLDDLIRENGDYYNALNAFVRSIKQFESNKYSNFSEIGRSFASSLGAYLQQTSLKDDSKVMNGYLVGLNSLLTDNSIDTDKKKQYIQRAINQAMPLLSAEYNKIKGNLSTDDYHNMAQSSLNDPMIMISPFANNLKQELSKNDTYGKSIKMSQLAKDIETDFKNDNFSKLGEYFEKIPYNKEAFKKLNLKDEEINKMMDDANKIFKDLSSNLKEDDKKRLMYSMTSILSEESNKQFSSLDKSYSANSFNNANPDATTGLYLALNSASGAAEKGGKVSPENMAKMLGINPYAAGPGMGLGY